MSENQIIKGIEMYTKKAVHFLLIVTCCLFVAGCAQPSVKMQVEGLSPEEISTIKTVNKNISIVRIDGQKSVGFISFMLNDGQWAGEASLKAGEHNLDLMFDDGKIKSHYLYNVNLRAGNSYIIKHQTVNQSAFLWIEELDTGKSVGKVLASFNEPITDKNSMLDHSVYFIMEPPQEKGWLIAYRNSEQTAFAKEGSNLDETYGISIIMFELPNFKSKDEFVSFVKQGREKNYDTKRFNITKDEISYFDGRKDHCVSYHTIAVDREAVKRTRNKENMILEMFGYICRHPQNKNIAIDFDYSQRYYSGHRDESIEAKAHDTFELLRY